MKTKLIQTEYKIFEGKYNIQMPNLVQEGLQPLTSKDIMQYRIKAIQSNDENEMNFWLNQYFDTVDGLAYYKGLAYHKGKLIVVPKSDLLFNINLDSKLINGSLILGKEQYKELSKKYEAIERDKVKTEHNLTKKEVKEHPIWLKLAQEDRALLNEYTGAIFAKAKEVFDYDNNMGIYLPPDDEEQPVMRGWFLRNSVGRSGAVVGGSLDYDCCLLGVRAQNLEEVLEK